MAHTTNIWVNFIGIRQSKKSFLLFILVFLLKCVHWLVFMSITKQYYLFGCHLAMDGNFFSSFFFSFLVRVPFVFVYTLICFAFVFIEFVLWFYFSIQPLFSIFFLSSWTTKQIEISDIWKIKISIFCQQTKKETFSAT